MTRRPSDVKRGVLIMAGGLSDRIYAVTRWRDELPMLAPDDGNGGPLLLRRVTAIAKVDVTDQVMAVASTSPRLLGVVPELRDFLPEWPE